MFEIKNVIDHVQLRDELQWNQASTIISYMLSPHLKKGAQPINPAEINPYTRNRNKSAKDITPEVLEREFKHGKELEAYVQKLIKDGNKR